LAQQIPDLKEQFNILKAETGKGTDVSVTLQLVRQLASAPHHIRDPLRSWQPFRNLHMKLEFLVIIQRLGMRLYSVKAGLSPPPQILEISFSGY